MSEVYSIRDSLQGSLQTFVRNSGLDSTFLEELIRDFVVLLAAYREEDVPMFPSVFVAYRREDLSSILTTGKPVQLGSVDRTGGPASTILKDCAPLAREGWAVFVHIDDKDIAYYGVFRSARHSLSTGADEVIADLGDSVKLVMLRNCGHQSVEIYNTSRNKLTAVLKVATSAYSALDAHISLFVRTMTAGVAESYELQAYLKRVITGIVQHCHGTLLAVMHADDDKNSSNTPSGVIPQPCINFADLHAEAMKLRDADSLADLRAAEVLLEGMIGSDGIVVFGNDATVKAYRSFIKPNPEEEVKIGTEGGARRRTFALMKLRLSDRYLGAFYRSQDGDTKCEVRQ